MKRKGAKECLLVTSGLQTNNLRFILTQEYSVGVIAIVLRIESLRKLEFIFQNFHILDTVKTVAANLARMRARDAYEIPTLLVHLYKIRLNSECSGLCFPV